jgi:hypothetical protein
MKRKNIYILTAGIIVLLIAVFIIVATCRPKIKNQHEAGRNAAISPDYSQTVIPPNIAPLNFVIKEEGRRFYVKIYSDQGDTIKIVASKPVIMIPHRKWKKLLNKNAGNNVYFDIYAEEIRGHWIKYQSISNHIARENIDSYLVYRLINPGYILWDKLGIYKRNIESFDESPVMVNDLVNKNCMNCHSFCQNDPDHMLFHIRGNLGGTIIYRNGQLKKINTGTEYTMSAGVYPAWHPGGNIIAFSVNKISQKFYSAGAERIEVYDRSSDIILYDIEANMVTTSPSVSTKNKESMPVWSPDGKYLYFGRANKPEGPQPHDSMMYDLLRIPYDVESGQWGEIDTILTAREAGHSISWPRISPDGRYLLFCMSDHGYFSIHYPSSDLYIMDLQTMKYKRLDISSDNVDSFHSWSHNGRWFVFASKQMNGLCSRPFFSYFDESGNAHKPFVLPQKDPEFYSTYLKNYNVPELVSERIDVNKWKLTKTVRSKAINATFDPAVDVDALSGATRINK